MLQKFTRTLLVSSVEDFAKISIRPGQWVCTETGSRGQFLGVTTTGTAVIRWQKETAKFQKKDAKNNHHLRQFAKVYGAK